MKVLALPPDPNPYQSLLYRGISNEFQILSPVRARWLFLTFPAQLIYYRLRGCRIIHLHWIFFLRLPVPGDTILHRLFNEFAMRLFMTSIRLFGFSLVWTVHNVVPHERQAFDDEEWTRRMCRQAAALIVHSASVIDDLRALGADTRRAVVIPHGNYRGIYEGEFSRDEARNTLGFDLDATIFLFFGAIRKYKGVSELITEFGCAAIGDARLVVAGDCKDPELRASLIAQAEANPRVTLALRRVPDDEVAVYFAAADVACLPFTAITTSGSALLALSFGKPLLGPAIGGLADLPPDVGHFYEPHQESGLRDGLTLLASDQELRRAMSEAATKYADELDWDVLSGRTEAVYRAALDMH